jgi:sugar lactone lactonase YvrE
MMTVSPREAHLSKHRISLAAIRSSLLLMLLALLGASAFAQGLSPGGPVNFGSINLQQTSPPAFLTFTAPNGGTTITSITAVTEGVTGKDFAVVPGSTCLGVLTSHESCRIYLSFTPQQIGLRLGALTITDSSNTVVNLVYLYGIGVGPQLVFQPATASAVATAASVGSFTPGTAVQDPNGNIIFLDVANNRILEETPATPPASPVFSQIYPILPSTTSILTLTNTSGLAIDGTGTLYISSGTSVYSLVPGAATPSPVSIIGVTLNRPAGLAVDPFGDLYIADSGNNLVYEVPQGGGNTFALPLPGLAAPATLSGPTGLFVDENLTLYIADTGNNRIVEIPLTGAPTATSFKPTSLLLSGPTGVAVDPAGTVYIADTGNQRIVEATAPGDQFVLSTVPTFNLAAPAGVLIKSNGDLVVNDTTLPGLVTFVRSTANINFPTPTEVGTLDTTAGEDPETLTVQGTGNIVSTLNSGTDPSFTGPQAAAFLLAPNPPSTCPTPSGTFTIGEVCIYDLNFQPTIVGLNTAGLVLTTTAAGGLTSSNSATLTGTGFSTLKYFTLDAISAPPTTPTTVHLGDSVELVLTAHQSGGAIATDYTGTITFTTSDLNGIYQSGNTPGSNTSAYPTTGPYTFINGVLTLPVAAGLKLNQYGIWTATATADPASLPPDFPAANNPVTSNPIYVIEPATLTLTSSVNPSAVNQSTTFTLTITTTGTVTPAGTVTFYNGGTAIDTVPVTVIGSGAVGTASIPDSFATPGSYPITATYTSTSNTTGGTASLTQLVGNTTSVTLTSSINPSLVGQSTNLTATISSLGTFGAPTGTIQFFDGTTSLGTVAVSGIAATLPASFSTAGTHNLTAVYTSTNPDLTNATSTVYAQHVLNLAALVLTSSVNPSTPGQSTTLTATLTALGTPTGTIKFYDGTTLLGTATLPADSLSVSFTAPGNHILTAVYSGDTLTETATSPPLTQVVLYTTTATLTSSVNPIDVNASTTLTATVHASTGTPTGTVTFKSNGITIGTGTLSGGVATLVTSFRLPGVFTLVAVYGGDTSNQPATTNTVLETVLNLITVSLTSSVNPVFLDNPTILTAILTSAAAGVPPTGTISFFDGSTPIGTGAIVNGTVSVTASFVYAGSHSITAVYSGDAASAPATSPMYAQTVADFSLTVASGGSATGSTIAGGTVTYSLVVTPIITTTLPGPITLTYSGLPASVTGTLTPATIATGSGATPVAFAVTAAPLSLTAHLQPHHSRLGYAPITLALLALPLAWFRRRKRFASLVASICLLFAITAGLSGCVSAANTGYYGQTPQTYNLTVTATSGNLSRSTYLTLTVQ